LVADLEGDDSTALSSRLNPTTAGGRAWRNRDSEAILQELAAFSARDRAIHARFFVRWLRADMRKEAK
jgi:hypothetical protein